MRIVWLPLSMMTLRRGSSRQLIYNIRPLHSLTRHGSILEQDNLKMQQLFVDALQTRWYFAMGAPEKTSLSVQYCRENGFEYLSSPTVEQLQKCKSNCIIEGTYELFQQVQKIKSELYLIFFGTDFSNQKEKMLRKEYMSIGYCKNVPVLEHGACRKALYPNLVFVYGPDREQNIAAAETLARNLRYQLAQLPADPNNLLHSTLKTKNYIINGLFTNPEHIKILFEYFSIRIIHFKYNRQDLPRYSAFFDQEYDLLKFLKGKPYYHQIKGDDDPVLIMDNVGIQLCSRLIYINYDKSWKQARDYVDQYVQETDGLVVSIYSVQHIRKRKGLPIAKDFQGKLQIINEVIYRDLSRKEILFTDFPWHTTEFIALENYNRKFSYFVDLTHPQKYSYSKEYSSPIYFLEGQNRIAPSFDLSLKDQLNSQIQYWVVNGPGTCGKTAIAKYVAAQFGFKLIQFQAEAAAAKEKIASPEDGDEVPVRKYVAYFANIIKSNPQTTYIFDSLPYNNADLQLWVNQVGCPNVINLKVQPNELIKRARKKAEADVNAEVTEEETAKANEGIQKNGEWVQKLGEYGPSSKIYQVDYNLPQILSEPYINSILRPRIFLVQPNIYLVYQNIAIRHGLGFINLAQVPLRQSAPLVRKCGRRDVILCYYAHDNEKLVCEDMYWIQKQLGEIRYLGIWQPEEIQVKDKFMKLERPPEPVKAKPAEGEEEKEEEPPADGEEDGKPKKVFDIYSYQWSQPVDHKNLSQWFFKLKKKITKKNSHPKSCYNTFQQVLDSLNKDKNQNFYQVIK